jgi:hypothetical protein
LHLLLLELLLEVCLELDLIKAELLRHEIHNGLSKLGLHRSRTMLKEWSLKS